MPVWFAPSVVRCPDSYLNLHIADTQQALALYLLQFSASRMGNRDAPTARDPPGCVLRSPASGRGEEVRAPAWCFGMTTTACTSVRTQWTPSN